MQDLTGLRKGFGLYWGEIRGRHICILKKMSVVALCPVAWTGLQ